MHRSRILVVGLIDVLDENNSTSRLAQLATGGEEKKSLLMKRAWYVGNVHLDAKREVEFYFSFYSFHHDHGG